MFILSFSLQTRKQLLDFLMIARVNIVNYILTCQLNLAESNVVGDVLTHIDDVEVVAEDNAEPLDTREYIKFHFRGDLILDYWSDASAKDISDLEVGDTESDDRGLVQ